MTPLALARKIRNHFHLLKNDPEKFGANLLQITNPEKFQEKLLDVTHIAPMYVDIDPTLKDIPHLNILQPTLSPANMTGGPNTVINMAFWIAMQNVPVRIVTAHEIKNIDHHWFWQHLASVTGRTERPPNLLLVSASDPSKPISIGPCDMFLATHWTTAQQIKKQLLKMDVRTFFYLIQDFEPGFYAWSSDYAQALETYELDHIGVFNERFLYDYLVANKAGRYANHEFAARALVFEPAVDRKQFHPPTKPKTHKKRRLLFYARPGNPRNMLGLGLNALRAAVADPAFQQDDWEFLAIGGRGSLTPIAIGPGVLLTPAPWVDYAGYGGLLREADILLCPMLSPHTSYPVLEMAASGGITVTNTFGTKTREALEAISKNIIASSATEDGFTRGLIEAAQRVHGGFISSLAPNFPADWHSSLFDVTKKMAETFRLHACSADR